MLRRQGLQVTVYDRYDRAGGLLIYGIPGFKLEKDVVMRRNDQLAAGGVTLPARTATSARTSPSTRSAARHDAVLIATGVYKSRDLGGPGAGLRRHRAGDRLPDRLEPQGLRRRGAGVRQRRARTPTGKRVVVIGGGDTAMDCVRTAVRQGATKVTCLYRRDRANMPGSQREVANAEEEGVEFAWLTAPRGFTGDGDGRGRAGGADAARARRTRPGGRRRRRSRTPTIPSRRSW